MKSKKLSRKEVLDLCSEIYPDDGIDPKRLTRKRRNKNFRRKNRQLCAQISRAINMVLVGEYQEPLSNLYVVSVAPAADSSQVMVAVAQHSTDKPASPNEILAALHNISGKFRSEIAAAINRRRTPTLSFCVVDLPTENMEG